MNETQNQRARVLGMHGFGLEVPDLDEAEKYYTAFGLVLRHKGECLAFACPGRDQDEVVIAKGVKKRLHHVAFSINPNQVEGFKTALRDRNIRFREQPPRGGYSEGLWFLDPWGTWLNLVPRLPAPPRDVQRDFASNEFGEKKRISIAGFRRLDTSGLPRKLGHIVMFTPDWAKAEAYYTDVLGLQVTERAVGKVSFFNAPLGDSWDHHCFAILANPGAVFNTAVLRLPVLTRWVFVINACGSMVMQTGLVREGRHWVLIFSVTLVTRGEVTLRFIQTWTNLTVIGKP